jgi:K+-sensing histidine kinase KdpD
LLRVLRHLIKNAIRFRRSDARLLIRIHAQTDDQFHCLMVEDNGVGVPDENLEGIFRLIPNINQQAAFDGHGLGLASCRRAVHRMNGRLWAERSDLGGCRICLRLPKA